MPQLDGAPYGQGGIRLSDRHLIMGVVLATTSIVGFKNELAFVANKEAVGFTGFWVGRFFSDLMSKLKNEFLVPSIDSEGSNFKTILAVFRGSVDEWFFKIGDFLF